MTPVPLAPWKRDPGRPRIPRWLAGLALLLGVFLAGAGVYVLLLASTRSTPVPASSPRGYRAEDDKGLAAGRPRVLVRESDGARFLKIAGGAFRMGNDFEKTGSSTDDDQPAHPVELSDFYLQETEVTNGELEAYFLRQKIEPDRRPKLWQAAWDTLEKAGRDPRAFPAAGVPYALAEQYARSVGGHLPTEAQWEFAARSRGKPIRYVWGNEPKPDHRLANINSLGDNLLYPTTEVRQFQKDRTEQGVHDLTGNVREWCRDCWADYDGATASARDPQGPPPPRDGPAEHVVRGGSFATWADQFRTTRPRRPVVQGLQGDLLKELESYQTTQEIGFRVVIEWPKASP
jgi:serine/threonine-protein kinase